jgi:hypothetical protein
VLRSAKRFKAATDYAVAFQGFHPIYNLGTTRKSLRSQKVQNSIRKIASVAALLAAQRVFGRPKTPFLPNPMKALPHRMKQQQAQR